MTHWHCLAAPPADPTCPATGTTQASAERHTNERGHVTLTHEATWVQERKAA